MDFKDLGQDLSVVRRHGMAPNECCKLQPQRMKGKRGKVGSISVVTVLLPGHRVNNKIPLKGVGVTSCLGAAKNGRTGKEQWLVNRNWDQNKGKHRCCTSWVKMGLSHRSCVGPGQLGTCSGGAQPCPGPGHCATAAARSQLLPGRVWTVHPACP